MLLELAPSEELMLCGCIAKCDDSGAVSYSYVDSDRCGLYFNPERVSNDSRWLQFSGRPLDEYFRGDLPIDNPVTTLHSSGGTVSCYDAFRTPPNVMVEVRGCFTRMPVWLASMRDRIPIIIEESAEYAASPLSAMGKLTWCWRNGTRIRGVVGYDVMSDWHQLKPTGLTRVVKVVADRRPYKGVMFAELVDSRRYSWDSDAECSASSVAEESACCNRTMFRVRKHQRLAKRSGRSRKRQYLITLESIPIAERRRIREWQYHESYSAYAKRGRGHAFKTNTVGAWLNGIEVPLFNAGVIAELAGQGGSLDLPAALNEDVVGIIVSFMLGFSQHESINVVRACIDNPWGRVSVDLKYECHRSEATPTDGYDVLTPERGHAVNWVGRVVHGPGRR